MCIISIDFFFLEPHNPIVHQTKEWMHICIKSNLQGTD